MLMTLPSAMSDKLMLAPSFRVAPEAPVLAALSDPARSTVDVVMVCDSM